MLLGRVKVVMMAAKFEVFPMGPCSFRMPCPPRCCSASLTTAPAPPRLLLFDGECAPDQARLSRRDLATVERENRTTKEQEWEASQARPVFANPTAVELFYDNRTLPDTSGGKEASRRSVIVENINHIQGKIVDGDKRFVAQKSFNPGRNPVFRSSATIPKTSGFPSTSGRFLENLLDSRIADPVKDYQGAYLPQVNRLAYPGRSLAQPSKSLDQISEWQLQGEVSPYSSMFDDVMYSSLGSQSKDHCGVQSVQSRVQQMQRISPAKSNSLQDLAESKPKYHYWDYGAESSFNQSKHKIISLVDGEKVLQLSRLPQYAPRLMSPQSKRQLRNRKIQIQRKTVAYARQRLLKNEEEYFQVLEQLLRPSNNVQQHKRPEKNGPHEERAPVSQSSLHISAFSPSGLEAWVEEGERYKTNHEMVQHVSATPVEPMTICSPPAYNQSQIPTEKLPGRGQTRGIDSSSMSIPVCPSEDDNLENKSHFPLKPSYLTNEKAGNAEQMNTLGTIAGNAGRDYRLAEMECQASVDSIDFQKKGHTVMGNCLQQKQKHEIERTFADTNRNEKQETRRVFAGRQSIALDLKSRSLKLAEAKVDECQQPSCLQHNDVGLARLSGYQDLDSGLQVVNAMVDEQKHSVKLNHVEIRVREATTKSNDVLVIDDIATATSVVKRLMGEYRDLVHACDTEVADIDVKEESPVGHGYMTCFSIYCGPNADFGDGKSRLWVDVLDSKEEVLELFKVYFEDPGIKKVWHNFSFDRHILANHGIRVSGFHADTIHLARLWDSARKGAEGGYSLEALTSDPRVVDIERIADGKEHNIKKTSMKELFGRAMIKRDGTKGKVQMIPPVEELQRSEEDRPNWIRYSAGDAVSTWHLWQSLQMKLKYTEWKIEGVLRGNMYDFYLEYWQPFGELLVQMESDGMLVDRGHLANIEKIACAQQQAAARHFQKWACKYCPDALYMNVGSDAQVRQLLFGGMSNRNNPSVVIPTERVFQVPNTDNYIEEGKKVAKKCRPIVLRGIGVKLPVDWYTSSGWPAVSGASLKSLAGKVAIDYTTGNQENIFTDLPEEDVTSLTEAGGKQNVANEKEDLSNYGKAYEAFGGGQKGREACSALAALCEMASIDTLISNFIQPLQGGQFMGLDGRVHCSLNINTETGRLSARRPSLQNQPALEKDRYKIRQAFVAGEGKSLIVADYGQVGAFMSSFSCFMNFSYK
ncbi:hypothetical protein O6H91_06G122400 [Diphasiastrum complanatum]|uniref:Uncharacterized protein n=1 Tax=Diphasiastrum complanatum TaxID=34168 RepID=A0ACC2DJ40_DIPCM|nr:hypothetical protein O6H91_06G122400 [Diphasiastrum complanatum]